MRKKYIIKKFPVLESWVFTDYEYKSVYKTELQKFLLEGWEVHKIENPIFSELSKFWNSYDRDKKTDIILVFVGAILGFILSKL